MISAARTLGLLACAALVGSCGDRSSGDRSPGDEAPQPRGNASPSVSSDASTPEPKGAAVVKVELRQPAASLVRSPGRNRCGGVRHPAAVVHHLHGLSSAVVWLTNSKTPAGAAKPAAPKPSAKGDVFAEIRIRDCALQPRITLLPGPGADLVLINGDERRRRVKLQRVAPDRVLAGKLLLDIPLALVGQRVPIALDRPGTYRLVTASAPDDPAYIVVASEPGALITDRRGEVIFTDLAPGEYQVTAWHPMGAGVGPRTVTGRVRVEAGKTTRVTLSVAKS